MYYQIIAVHDFVLYELFYSYKIRVLLDDSVTVAIQVPVQSPSVVEELNVTSPA